MKNMMRYTESRKKIYVTRDYDMFKPLLGNREVTKTRVNKAVESIQKFGWLTEPILVNEKYEVIDGQGRLAALKELGMPVEFVIEKGIGRNECQGLNLYQKNWTVSDYIESFIAEGNDDYMWLKEVIAENKVLSTNFVISALVSENNSAGYTGNWTNIIAEGRFTASMEKRRKMEAAFEYLKKFAAVQAQLGGRRDVFYTAILFLYNLEDVDNSRLLSTVTNAMYDGMVSSGTVEGWLRQLEGIYNKRLSKANKIDFVGAYRRS